MQNILRRLASFGLFGLLLRALDQLKEFAEARFNWACPVDFAAEVKYFKQKFPFRKFKIDSLLRSLNRKDDIYPTHLGKPESYTISKEEDKEMQKLRAEHVSLFEVKADNNAHFCEYYSTEAFKPSFAAKVADPLAQTEYTLNGPALLTKLLKFSLSFQMEGSPEVEALVEKLVLFGGLTQVNVTNPSPYCARLTQLIHSYHLALANE